MKIIIQLMQNCTGSKRVIKVQWDIQLIDKIKSSETRTIFLQYLFLYRKLHRNSEQDKLISHSSTLTKFSNIALYISTLTFNT